MADKPHSNALRKGRFSAVGQIYLVTTRCHKRRRIFNNIAHGRLVVDEILRSGKTGLTRTIAYVVMPDHLHWLVELRSGNSLSMAIGSVKGKSAFRINHQGSRSGRIWQPGFHDHAVRREENLQTLGDYVVHNPVRAGIVRNIDDYPLWDATWISRGISNGD